MYPTVAVETEKHGDLIWDRGSATTRAKLLKFSRQIDENWAVLIKWYARGKCDYIRYAQWPRAACT
jgi:hypothetical protein